MGQVTEGNQLVNRNNAKYSYGIWEVLIYFVCKFKPILVSCCGFLFKFHLERNIQLIKSAPEKVIQKKFNPKTDGICAKKNQHMFGREHLHVMNCQNFNLKIHSLNNAARTFLQQHFSILLVSQFFSVSFS